MHRNGYGMRACCAPKNGQNGAILAVNTFFPSCNSRAVYCVDICLFTVYKSLSYTLCTFHVYRYAFWLCVAVVRYLRGFAVCTCGVYMFCVYTGLFGACAFSFSA